MLSEEIREQTASELLTIDEEYENQQSWYEDPKKCTFIILDKELVSSSSYDDLTVNDIDIKSMVGDINIFFNDFEELGTGELEIMIAEPSSRRKGLGKEAIGIMMEYAIKNLLLDGIVSGGGVERFIVKIGQENQPSITLFKNHFHFIQQGDVNVFGEVNLLLPVSDDIKQSYSNQFNYLTFLNWIDH
eukprot:gene802-997_t